METLKLVAGTKEAVDWFESVGLDANRISVSGVVSYMSEDDKPVLRFQEFVYDSYGTKLYGNIEKIDAGPGAPGGYIQRPVTRLREIVTDVLVDFRNCRGERV